MTNQELPYDRYVYKADKGKEEPVLLEVSCVHALEALQATLEYGKQKYAADSWQNVEPLRYDNAARRHRRARDRGELRDKESGLLHLQHEIICNIFLLEMFIRDNPDVDYKTFFAPPLDHKTPATSAAPPMVGRGIYVSGGASDSSGDRK